MAFCAAQLLGVADRLVLRLPRVPARGARRLGWIVFALEIALEEFGNARLGHPPEGLVQQLEPLHLGALHLRALHPEKTMNVRTGELLPAP